MNELNNFSVYQINYNSQSSSEDRSKNTERNFGYSLPQIYTQNSAKAKKKKQTRNFNERVLHQNKSQITV